MYLRFLIWDFRKKVHAGDIRIKACCLLIKPTPAVEYGNTGSIIRWESTLPKKRQNHTGGCEHLIKNATGNSMLQIKTTYISLPSFLNPPRGSINYFDFFEKGFPVPTFTIPFLVLLSSNLWSWTKEDVFFRRSA